MAHVDLHDEPGGLHLSGGCSPPAHHANQHVPLLLFVRPQLTHSTNSTEKMTFERRFRMCERVVHVVEMACISQIAPSPPSKKTSLVHRHQSKKQGQNFFYDMCVTPTNIVEVFNTWPGCIGLLKVN
jgi:hypothetical protein